MKIVEKYIQQYAENICNKIRKTWFLTVTTIHTKFWTKNLNWEVERVMHVVDYICACMNLESNMIPTKF